jgi:ATP-dependent DNA helicase RecG
MYQLQDPVLSIKGIGKNLQATLESFQIQQILDFLLFLPLRYEDRSTISTISEIKNSTQVETVNQAKNQQVKTNFVTTKAKVSKWNEYRKGRLLISRATITDETDQINCLWFNNKFLKNKMLIGQEYFFSGQIKDGTLMQATVEKIEGENIHTGRLVPVYSQLAELKQGNIRRLLAEVLGKLHQSGEAEQIFHDLHFPANPEDIINARERLALEEMIFLIQKSALHKKQHQAKKAIFSFKTTPRWQKQSLPFTLTKAQEKAVSEIMQDLSQKAPMNRLLGGDVGSGKTIVAAIPAREMVLSGQNVCLIVPTKILAKQHLSNLSAIFQDLDLILIDSENKLPVQTKQKKGVFYIGTHALLSKLNSIKPSLVIYDEQQRFGVRHRQLEEHLQQAGAKAHLLNMTATPIPRSLMLSIFSHLELSYLDQMPNARKMAHTWLIPEEKREKALEWLVQELSTQNQAGARKKQALIICPFINPSSYQATENVAAVQAVAETIKKDLQKIYQKLNLEPKNQLALDLLHSKIEKKQQARVIEDVYQQKTQLLISTPMVEVGVDLPNADIIVIESAERFGLSSLHQLRGRVGRQGQESYCLLFSSKGLNNSQTNLERLQKFCQEKNGLKLAELDLANRGAGDLLGYQQSGFANLQFASWTNLQIIEQAKAIVSNKPDYSSFLQAYLDQKDSTKSLNHATN